ncbi:MAG TPA: hypothetical protein VLS89_02190 [Candidatus Nanopelagicales bacterium]|nr:hypothetical protein [Candidatus Nanopelagicales bacterium]
MSEIGFLEAFYNALTDEPLEAGDPKYVHLYEGATALGDDPVKLLAFPMRKKGQSVQLLSGYRGTGKSTELRRLEALLVQEGHQVVLLNMDQHLNMTTPVDVSDFLMTLAGAFGEALDKPEHLGRDPRREGYWERFVAFLTRTKISLPEASATGIKANLKSDPTFRETLQNLMKGHLGALVADVHEFFEDCVKALKQRHPHDPRIVLLVDSVEHIRGTFLNAREVQASVETLFMSHAEKLRLPYMHVVYTVPPYLKARAMNIGSNYGEGAVQVFPAIKIRHYEGDGHEGEVHAKGVDSIRTVVERRCPDWKRLLGDETALNRVILMSGGNLRDLFRLLSEIIRRADALPVPPEVVEKAINQMRTEFLPIADADAAWLAQIAGTHQAALPSVDRLPDLTRFLDTHVVLTYRNGPEWYDVHPLIRDLVMAQARRLEQTKASAGGR